MSLVLQNPLSITTYRIKFYSQIITTTHFNPTKTLKFSLFHRQSLQFKAYPLYKNLSFLQNRLSHIKSLNSPISAFEEEQKSSTQLFKFDAFLLFLESICIVSSVAQQTVSQTSTSKPAAAAVLRHRWCRTPATTCPTRSYP